ncbi:MAG: hypothetical protein AAFU85_33870, partial [Planctomycetota bacterium]
LYVRDFPITSRDDQRNAILGMLTAEFGVLAMGNAQEWTGPLIDLRQADPNVDRAMGVLLGFLQVQDAVLRCSTDPEQGALLKLIGGAVASIVQAQHDAAPDQQPKTAAYVQGRIDEITGGSKFPGVDAAAIADARQTHADALAETARVDEIQALQAEIENDHINAAIADGVSTAADVRAAIKAGL